MRGGILLGGGFRAWEGRGGWGEMGKVMGKVMG